MIRLRWDAPRYLALKNIDLWICYSWSKFGLEPRLVHRMGQLNVDGMPFRF